MRWIHSCIIPCVDSHTSKASAGAAAAVNFLRQLYVDQVQDLSKVYTTRKGSFVAAENISLDIPAGKMTALLGPSGSGILTSCVAGTDRHPLRSGHAAMKGWVSD